MDRTARIIGVPTDYGTNRRGVDMGPSAIRYAGLAETLEANDVDCLDRGDIPVTRPESAVGGEEPTGGMRYREQVRDVTERLASRVEAAVAEGELPLVLGGDHSVAIGTLRGGGTADESIGVVWFDAHGDCNTPETSPSGNGHGMPLAAALGLGSLADEEWGHAPCVDAENVALVGLRDLDEGERDNIRESDVTAFTMSDVDERGIADVVDEALDVACGGTDGVHVSLDLDWLDPTEAPGVGTPVRGGVTYREAHTAMEAVAERTADHLRSLELVEVNPILDSANETAELAVELAASAFGRRIL